MEVHLKPDQEAFIQHRVSVGAYATADEAVQAAVDLLEERESSTKPARKRSPTQIETRSEQRKTGADLVAVMQASPFKEIELQPSRPHMSVRDVTL